MFEPGDRRLFLDILRPPEGYKLDRAIGTTYTLDLTALLSVPLAFTFSDAHDANGKLAADPLTLLESARQYASRIMLFCHGGQTDVPRPGHHVLAFIEETVITALPPWQGGTPAVFHPKIWVLRYQATEESDPSIRYRLVCQSRNLTFDTSWDACVVLDGQLMQQRTRGFGLNRPLSDFVGSLPDLACGPVPTGQRRTIDEIAHELRRVCFVPPNDLSLSRFLAFGMGSKNPEFPDLEHRPILVISPFLDDDLLRNVVTPRPRAVLVSRHEALVRTDPDVIANFDEVYSFNGTLDLEDEDSEGGPARLGGLHAKVYVIDDGRKARLIIGSANSTRAALGNRARNVEFMVELTGKKTRFGIDALLNPPKHGTGAVFRSLLECFDPSEAGTAKEDADESKLDIQLDAAAATLARANIIAKVEPTEKDRYSVRLQLGEPLNLTPPVDSVYCWPATLPEDRRQPLIDGAEFSGQRVEDISGFLAIEVQVSLDGKVAAKRFVRPVGLEGVPDDRMQRLLAGMLKDRTQLMRLLWLLLATDEPSFAEFTRFSTADGAGLGSGLELQGLLERMLAILGKNPERLDAVARLVDDLRKSDMGKELLGKDFDPVWDPIWEARKTRK